MSDTITKVDGKWLLNQDVTITTQATDLIDHTFHTAGTFVDSDIEVKFSPKVQNGVQEISTINETVVAPKVESNVDGTLISAEGVSSTQPTSGTYKTIKAVGTASTGSVTTQPKVNTTTGGWISTGYATGNEYKTTVTPTTSSGAVYYIPVVEPTINPGTVNTSAATNKITTTVSTSTTATKYTIDASATGTIKLEGTTYTNAAGYIDAHTQTAVSTSSLPTADLNSTADQVYITEGSCTVSGGDLSLAQSSVSTASQAVAISVDGGNVNSSVITAAPTDGSYYIAVKTETTGKDIATVTASRGAVTDVHTEGYIEAGTTTPIASTSTSQTVSIASGTDTKYVKVDKGSISANLPSAVTNDGDYESVSTATIQYIPSGGNLYLEEGYYKKQKISLAQLVPDEATMKAASSTGIVVGQKAYDSDGNLITGALSQNNSFDFTGGVVTSTASVVSDNVGLSTVNNGIAITASAVAERTAVSYETTLGYTVAATGLNALSSATSNSVDAVYYISSLTIPEGQSLNVTDNGTINVSTSTTSTVNVGGTAVMTNGEITVGTFNCVSTTTDAELAVEVSTATVGTNVVNAASGAATTVAPSTGVYIAVNTGTDKTTVNATAKTTKAGWISTGTTVTSDDITVSVSSGTAYVPVKETTFTASIDSATISQTAATSTASITITNPTSAALSTTTPSSGSYLTIAPKVAASQGGSVTMRAAASVAESGWATAGTVYSTSVSQTTDNNATTDKVNYYIPIYGGSVD